MFVIVVMMKQQGADDEIQLRYPWLPRREFQRILFLVLVTLVRAYVCKMSEGAPTNDTYYVRGSSLACQVPL